jgi:VWFA-related protein
MAAIPMRHTLLACGALAVTVSLAAQQSAQTPVFRAGTDYVRVDVVVTDKNDRPIADLTKADFTIEERGRAQSIDDFEFVSVPVEHRTIDVKQSAPPADVATNIPRSPKSRLFVMVIDDLHILEQDLVPVKRIMTEFFQALSPDDEVAVVFVSHSNDSQNFTNDPALLMKTVDRVRDALGFGLDALGHSTASNVIQDSKSVAPYARSADLTMINVAKSLAGSGHSRRAIVYVSSGSVAFTAPEVCPQSCPSDFDDLQVLYETARRSNVPIYTIDPRGQAQPEDAVRGGIGAIGNFGGAAGEGQRAAIAANIVRQQNRLAENAINTGGRAFTNQSNLTKAVDEIVGDNGSYYLLGYYPNPFASDGKFHELKVKVNRPGVIVRARQGYVASSVAPAVTDLNASLDSAMSAGVNVSGIELRAFAAPVAVAAKGVSTIVTVEVVYPPRAVDARQIDEELHLSVVAIDPDAKIKASSAHAFHFTGTAGDGPLTFLLDDTIDLPAEPLTLKVGVASRVLGKTGTIQLPIDVPKTSGKLQLGGIVLGLSAAGHEPAMQGGASKTLVPFQPTTTRVFSAGDTLRVFTRAFWGSQEDAVSVTVSAAGPAASPPKTFNISRDKSGAAQATLDAAFPLGTLVPGRYQLVVTARLANGQTATRMVPFEIK